MKKKISLSEIKVKSFLTELTQQNRLNGKGGRFSNACDTERLDCAATQDLGPGWCEER